MILTPLATSRAILCAIAPLATISAHAADAMPSDVVVLGAPPAPAPGVPAYGEVVIDRVRLESVASGRIEDALADVPGFSLFRRSDSRSSNPSAQGANLRALGGNATSRTLVLLDAVPLADPFFGYIPYSAIVPERLSAARVTRGGGIGSFGAGAVAGTISLESATRDDLPLLSARVFYGSRDSVELSGAVSPDLGAGFVSLSGRYDRSDGFFTTPPDARVAASVPAAHESWSASLRAVAPVNGDGELQTRMLVYRDERTLRFAGANSRSEGQDASIRYIGRGDWGIDALAYLQARNFANVVISSTSFRRTLDQRDTPALGLGGKLAISPPVGSDHVLRIGMDARRSSGNLREDSYNAGSPANPLRERRRAEGAQTDIGAFVEDDWTIGDIVLTGGARIDRWTIGEASYEAQTAAGMVVQDIVYAARDGWEANGRAGVLWRLEDALTFRAAAYTGFRMPTLNELYRGFVVFPVETRANPNLAPERLRGVEAAVDWSPASGIRLMATAFANRLDNAIANVTIAPNLRERRNVDAIVARGIELSGDAAFGAVDLAASWSLTDARIDAPGTALDGLRPAQTPRHAVSATLGWTQGAGRPAPGARVAVTLRYAGAQFEDDLNVDRMPDALTIDGYARLPFARGMAIVGRVENLFDERIVTRLVTTGGREDIDLGTPRTVWIGISFTG